MKFMLFTYRDPTTTLDPTQRAAIPAAVEAWCSEMDQRGVRLAGHVLDTPAEAKTVRRRDGQLLVSDGPSLEGNTQIVGFSILECADLDEALEVAAKNPGATFGILELRAFAE